MPKASAVKAASTGLFFTGGVDSFYSHIENKEEIKERIEQLQSINPLLQQDIKYLDVNYSNQAVWDYDINHLDAFTQDDKRYNQTNPLVKYDSNHLEHSDLMIRATSALLR